jgi:hypothetical protein
LGPNRYNRKTDKLEMSRTVFKYEELSTLGKVFYNLLTKFRLAHVKIGTPTPAPNPFSYAAFLAFLIIICGATCGWVV